MVITRKGIDYTLSEIELQMAHDEWMIKRTKDIVGVKFEAEFGIHPPDCIVTAIAEDVIHRLPRSDDYNDAYNSVVDWCIENSDGANLAPIEE